jgi:CDGSH-type Zn-finger protein|tara:strand:- start:395 stop:574 length:180 start_codon:yes stop_codon:yes gene_type:complete
MSVEINIVENGPILVKGKTNVTKNGKKIEIKEQYALCRCGQTKNQPYCDGAHKSNNFKG